jgi:hypothetical protein
MMVLDIVVAAGVTTVVTIITAVAAGVETAAGMAVEITAGLHLDSKQAVAVAADKADRKPEAAGRLRSLSAGRRPAVRMSRRLLSVATMAGAIKATAGTEVAGGTHSVSRAPSAADHVVSSKKNRVTPKGAARFFVSADMRPVRLV